ncbi:MAG: DUF362 domain-containing protein [Candidatus Heimdallarchaeota archaeon]
MASSANSKHLVVISKHDNKFTALAEVLEKTAFFDILERHFKGSNKAREDFSIVIKPNIMMAYSRKDPSTITDPELVEYLINEIIKRGFSKISVIESQNVFGNWFRNRDVVTVATYFGYSGSNYKIVDLTREKVRYRFKGRLGKHWIGPTWRDADFRISFAKNKTHFSCYFTLTLKNLYGCMPLQNKFKEYHQKKEFDWPTIEMLKEFWCHYGLIDAYWSADGLWGLKSDDTPVPTKTIIGGENIIAVEAIGAKKMGLNPMQSRIYKLAVEELQYKPDIECQGDDSVYESWINVPPFMDKFMDVGEEFYHVSNKLGFISSEMDPFFPPKTTNPIVRGIRWLFLKIARIFSRAESKYAEWHSYVSKQIKKI